MKSVCIFAGVNNHLTLHSEFTRGTKSTINTSRWPSATIEKSVSVSFLFTTFRGCIRKYRHAETLNKNTDFLMTHRGHNFWRCFPATRDEQLNPLNANIRGWMV